MSDYVTFNSISRAEPPGGPGDAAAGAVAGANGQPPFSEEFQAGFEAGLMAAREQGALRPEITAGGGDLVGGTRNDDLNAGDPLGMDPFASPFGMGQDPRAAYFRGMPGFGVDAGQPSRDPLGMDLFGFPSATPTGRPSFAMTGMPGFGQDPVAGALHQLNQLAQLLNLVAQLERLVSERQGDRGGQSDLMPPIGMPGGNDFMHGGPGSDGLGRDEMTIMPVGNRPENIGDMGDIGDVPPPSVDDPNLTAYERGVNERSRTGEGTIALETETRPSAEGYMAGPFSKEELGEILDYAMTDPTAMREAVSAELSGLEPPENVLAAFDELFDLLDAGDEDAFRNAFLNLARTDLGQFLVWGAVDVANDVRRGEMGGEPPGLDLDSEADIAEGLPINLDSDDVLAEDEPEAEAA